MEKPKALISDANVIIDIITADEEVLKIAAEYYEIYVPYVVLQEVNGLDEDKAAEFGLRLYIEELNMITSAQKCAGRLSVEDIVCFEIAKKESYTCLTNDKTLRAKCKTEGVSCMWGLQLLLELVGTGRLDKAKAITTAEKIRESNAFIKREIFLDFVRKLELF